MLSLNEIHCYYALEEASLQSSISLLISSNTVTAAPPHLCQLWWWMFCSAFFFSLLSWHSSEFILTETQSTERDFKRTFQNKTNLSSTYCLNVWSVGGSGWGGGCMPKCDPNPPLISLLHMVTLTCRCAPHSCGVVKCGGATPLPYSQWRCEAETGRNTSPQSFSLKCTRNIHRKQKKRGIERPVTLVSKWKKEQKGVDWEGTNLTNLMQLTGHPIPMMVWGGWHTSLCTGLNQEWHRSAFQHFYNTHRLV